MFNFNIYHSDNLSYDYLDVLYAFFKNNKKFKNDFIEINSISNLKYNKIKNKYNMVFTDKIVDNDEFSIVTTSLIHFSKRLLNVLIPYKNDERIRIYLTKPNKFYNVLLKKKGVKLLTQNMLVHNSILYSYFQHLPSLIKNRKYFVFVELTNKKSRLLSPESFEEFLSDLYS